MTFAIGGLCAVLAGLAVWLAWGRAAARSEVARLRSLLGYMQEQENTLRAKYDSLLADLKRVAMRPQMVERTPETGPKKARSSAEIRRMFERENAGAADKDQAAS